MSVSSALVRSIYPAGQLGRRPGVNSVIVSNSSALAPTLGGLILAVAPWPWVFASAVSFTIVLLLIGRTLPNPVPRNEPFDVLGAVLCAAMFGLVISGVKALVYGNSPVVSAAIVAAGAIVDTIFVRRERHEPRPIMPVNLLGTSVIALSAIGAFTAFIATMALLLSPPSASNTGLVSRRRRPAR